jgi:16S rRNA (guanine966-N2)-methyltransferase
VTLRLSGGRRLQSPPGDTARPTAARVRQAVLNLLAAELPGCRWLDLCCGSGVMACEALQRGASEVVAIERDRRVAAVARANLEAVAAGLGSAPPRLRVIHADARRWLASHAPGSMPDGPVPALQASPPEANAADAPGWAAVDAAPGTRSAAEREAGACHGQSADLVTLRQVQNSNSDSGPRHPGGEASDREKAFDLIYCDPPWPAGLHAPLSEAVIRGGWIRPGGTLIWECPSDQVPAAPAGWALRDARRYGGSTVVLLEPL